ncbi:MAG: AMP-binding protein [Acidimicrobiales bacterium]
MFDNFHLPPLEQRTIAATLERGAQAHPDKVALIDTQSCLTYGELLDMSMRTAGALAQLGVARGDRVLLMFDNHVDFALAWFGLALLGAVEIPVNTAYKGALLAHVVDTSGATTVIAESHYLPRFDELSSRAALCRAIVRGEHPGRASLPIIDWLDVRGSGVAAIYRNTFRDVAGIIYTSGTTGPSKGVVTYEAHAYNYSTPVALGAPTHEDVSYVALPQFHVGGHMCGIYAAVIAGATAYVPARFSTTDFWDDVARVKATFATLVGAMVNFLLSEPASASDCATSLRRVALAPISGRTKEFLERFGIEGCSGYGSTEAASPLCVPLGAALVPFAIGWPRPDYEARVVDEDDQPVALGDVGELVIRPREPWTIMGGYAADSDKTLTAWRNLWYHTGDGVRQRSEDGQFILVDRLSDSIRRRGENISSYAVEAAINAHADVVDSAVVGVPDEDSGQEVLAIVVVHPNTTLDGLGLLEYLVDQLPHFMVPRYIRFVYEDFERSPSGKIRKDLLRSIGTNGAWDRRSADIRVTRDGLVRNADGPQ